MIPSDFFETYRLLMIDIYDKTGELPHICNIKGVTDIRFERISIIGEHHILHAFTGDEIRGGFTKEAKVLLKEIILRAGRDYGFMQYPWIKVVS